MTAQIVLGGMLAATALAQQPQAAPPTLDKLTADWYTLANSLESRVTRMLPCDTRVRTAIDEVSRANASRLAARNSYWQVQSSQSRAQIEALRNLQVSLPAEAVDTKTDATDAQQEQTGLAGMTADLTDSAGKKSVLNAAISALAAISQQSATFVKLANDRDATIASLQQQIADAITAAEARQTAIEAEQKALGAEGARWTSYYVSRLTRAQMECAITGQAPKPAPRTPAPKAEATGIAPPTVAIAPSATPPANVSTVAKAVAPSAAPAAAPVPAPATAAKTAQVAKASPAPKAATKKRRRR
ncbi:MAG: hypothetical protein ABL995_08145 [Bryobacteraceae bacterium]